VGRGHRGHIARRGRARRPQCAGEGRRMRRIACIAVTALVVLSLLQVAPAAASASTNAAPGAPAKQTPPPHSPDATGDYTIPLAGGAVTPEEGQSATTPAPGADGRAHFIVQFDADKGPDALPALTA